ncbi:MAG: anhydro-N-acetylmuramic acid kinase [Raineya sp.]|jgi:anhydro-N-acetylmuramic acid kinase|nr:anhydro-N-acetylmuramic acid kinase [Raineya sp.]
MNYLQKLYNISQKQTKNIIGLMSGTSLDGLDIAFCEIEGFGLKTKIKVKKFTSIPYDETIKNKIRLVFAQKQVSLEHLTLLHNFLGNLFAKWVLKTLQEWQISVLDIDCIASHGQTIFHAPKRLHQNDDYGNATLQIADADQIAVKTGILTISDFRQKHIAAGAEGAPLVVYGDYLLFSNSQEDRVLLNVGGIANITFLSQTLSPKEVFATDVGTGNTLLDYFAQKFYQVPFDNQGLLARSGSLNQDLLDEMLSLEFFRQDFPKSTGQETFSIAWIENILAKAFPNILPQDLLCTLTHFTAQGILKALDKLQISKSSVYISGGGSKNMFLVDLLAKKLRIQDFEVLGVSADAKEAVLFALLANETLSDSSFELGKGQYLNPAVCMGKISLPI